MKTLTRGGPFRKAVEPLDDLRRPRFEIAANSTAVIEIDSGVRIGSCEDESDSIETEPCCGCSGLPIVSPCGRIGANWLIYLSPDRSVPWSAFGKDASSRPTAL